MSPFFFCGIEMRKTLLEIVQYILNEISSDAVNSISDTTESEQVALIVRGCFEEMVTNRNWPSHRKLIQFDESGDLTRPNYLKLPNYLKELSSFKYDKALVTDTSRKFSDVKYITPEEFLALSVVRDSTASNVETISDFNGGEILILNDQPPTYWTSFDDTYLVTDSYDSSVDTTLQKSKSQALAYIIPTWVHDDSAYPDLPDEAFPALIEEAKSTAFISVKEMANQKSEQKAQRQQRWLSRKAWRLHGGIQYPDYGRK